MAGVTIRLIANAGVLIDYEGRQILIDALHEGHRLYPGTPSEAIEALLDARPPFSHLEALVFTHNHIDHFSARLVLQVLDRYPGLPILADEATTASLIEAAALAMGRFDKSRIHTFQWQIGHDGSKPTVVGPFAFAPVSFEHEGKAFTDVANVGYLVTVGGRRILYPGDARVSPANFAPIADKLTSIDAAILMFPYISTGRGQSIIRDIIRPHQAVIVHWPDPARDPHDFLKHAGRTYERARESLPKTDFLMRYLDQVEI